MTVTITVEIEGTGEVTRTLKEADDGIFLDYADIVLDMQDTLIKPF